MEQKTIFEELLDEVPAVHEKHRKLAKAKHCVSREEWDDADAIYDEILAEFPDDEEALRGKLLLKRKKENAEEHWREEEKKQKYEEEKSRKPRRSKRIVLAVVLIFIMVLAAAAAVMGIISHKNSMEDLYAESETVITDTYLITEQKTDA